MWVSAAVAVVRFGAPGTERTAVAGRPGWPLELQTSSSGVVKPSLEMGDVTQVGLDRGGSRGLSFPQVFKGYVIPPGRWKTHC